MKRNKIIAIVAAAVAAVALIAGLLVWYFWDQTAGTSEMGLVYERMSVSLERGSFFFAGEVLSSQTDTKQITFYEEEMPKSTFYRVKVTEDYFGCMPERELTVCVGGSGESFRNRMPLEEGKEYVFEATLWLMDGKAIFLLPSFYDVLPEISDGDLYVTDLSGKYLLEDDYATYCAQMKALAKEVGYGPETVLRAMDMRLELAANDRNVIFFKNQKFTKLDEGAIQAVNRNAAALRERLSATEKTWEGIKELLK